MIERQSAERDLLAELATLGSLALATGRARTSRDVAASALDILARATGADGGVVLFDYGAGLTAEAGFGFPEGAVDAMVEDRGVSEALAAALDAAPGPVFGPVAKSPIRGEIAAALLANNLHYVLAAPLRSAGRLVGVLGLAWRAEPEVTFADATILHAAAVVGASLENAHLVARLQRTLASERRLAVEEATLQSLTLIAEKAGAFDELAMTTTRQVVALVGASAGSYALLTRDNRVVHSASVNVDRAFIESAADVPATEMVSLRPLFAGSGPYMADYDEDTVAVSALELIRERGWTTFALLPISIGERIEAVIALFFDQPPDLPDADRALSAISRIASISLANFRLRERLVASETQYRMLFEESPDAIILLSRTSEVIDANSAAIRLYRTDVEGLRAFLNSGGGRVGDDERQARWRVVAQEGRGVFRDTAVRPDGTTFPQEVRIVAVDMAGERAYLLIVRDLTEENRVQQELLQAQKMEAIGQLVSGVGHELNNPLAAIVAFSQLIRRDERLPEDMRRDAELLVQEADRTRRIVQSLLDFARQRPPERHPTSVRALIESVLALQSYSLTAGRIELTVDVPPDLPFVEIDRSQLQQVLLNLTLNAIQAIRAERSEGRISITARQVTNSRDDGHVRVTVSDNGPGIPEAMRSRLFLPFYTTKAPGEGTGLGLSVSFGIVASHNGSLRFEPTPGGGATFILELPVSAHARQGDSAAAAAARSVSAPADAPETTPGDRVVDHAAPVRADSNVPSRPPTAGDRATTPARATGDASDSVRPRVLVLDDEPAIRAFLTKALRLAGLDPVVVAAGEDAIARCHDETFAAVLVDHRMPGMSGTQVFDAAVAIRAELASRFIFMSGDVLNPELRTFVEAHGGALLAKPFDVDTVNGLVLEVVASASR